MKINTSKRKSTTARKSTRTAGSTTQPPVTHPPENLPPASHPEALSDRPTEILAHVDVGFGNHLFIRGSSRRLSWDQGQPLKCEDPSLWLWRGTFPEERISFKLLLNDELWARGDDVTVRNGECIEIIPTF